MAAYTSDTNLLIELPDNLPASVDTLSERLSYIQLASSMADGLVGPRFPVGDSNQKFPDITDSPPTPALIELATRKLASSMIYGAIGVTGRDGGELLGGQTLYADAMDMFDRVRTGELTIEDESGTDYATATPIGSTTEGVAASFIRGRYDTDGELLDDTSGSLDDF